MNKTNANVREQHFLQDFNVKYFKLTRDGVGLFPDSLTVKPNNDTYVFSLLVNGNEASPLNPPVSETTFTPSGPAFISSRDAISGAYIPATDGVYWNSLQRDADLRYTDWKKLSTPPGGSAQFADYVTEFSEDSVVRLYALKSSSAAVKAYVNEQRFENDLTKNENDPGYYVDDAFYDLDNPDNSLLLISENFVLNSDRSVSDAGTDAFSFADVNKIVKIDGVFYALLNSENLNAVYKTGVSPKTGPWESDTQYNPAVNLSSTYYLGPVDFLTRVPSAIVYNTSKRAGEWEAIKEQPVIWNSPTCDPETAVSCLSDLYDGVRAFEITYGGDDISYAGLFLSANENVATYDRLMSGNGVSKWLVKINNSVCSDFDLRGTADSYAIGHVRDQNSDEISAVVLDVPDSRIPTVVPYQDGENILYYKTFVFNGPRVHVFPNGTLLCGSAIELTAEINIEGEEEGSGGTLTEVFCAVPVFSNNALSVQLFVQNEFQYDWSAPDIVITFDESDFPPDIPRDEIVIQDILVCNSMMYAKLVHADPHVEGSNDYVQVFGTDINRVFNELIAPVSGAGRDGGIRARQIVNASFEPAVDSLIYSVYNVIKKSGSQNDAIVDFSLNQVRTIALKRGDAWTLPFISDAPSMPGSDIRSTMLDYALYYGATDLSGLAKNTFDLSFYSTARYDQLLGDTQLNPVDDVKALDSDRTLIWDYSFDGNRLSTSLDGNISIADQNNIAISFKPASFYLTSNTSATRPADFPFTVDSFGIAPLSDVNGERMTKVLVTSLSRAVTRDGYFYAALNDVTGVVYNPNPAYVSAETGDTWWQWTAEPVLNENTRYALLKINNGSISEITAGSIERREGDGGDRIIIGPDSWNLLTAADKKPTAMAFESWSLVKKAIFDENGWTSSNEVSIADCSGKYITLGGKRVLTWSATATSKKLFLLKFDGARLSELGEFDGSSVFAGDIVAVQSVNDETLYVFTATPESDGTTAFKIYSGPLASFGGGWSPTLIAEINGVDFFQDGSVYFTSAASETGEQIPMLFYSAVNGGIKSVSAKIKYVVVHETLAETSALPVDGNVLKESDGGVLVTGGNKLCSLVRYDRLINDRWQAGFDITQISSGVGQLRDVFLNYATRRVSSYTLINSNYSPALLELSADNARFIRNVTGIIPSVYDVEVSPTVNSYAGVRFYSSGGTIYQLSSNSYTPIGTTSREVYNGPALVSGMTYGFPTKADEKEFGTSAYWGELEEMHIPCFDIDLSGYENAIFIDNLYSTVKLSDDFGQTYWIAAAQLDNRTSSAEEDDQIRWTHYPQRYKLGELYDQPLRFTDVLSAGTVSAQTILTSRDGLVVYTAVPRADWNVTHFRKIVREQAHLDNVCEELELHPDYTNILKDIQTSPTDAVLLLQSGHEAVFHTNWRHDIKYFGPCVQPYTMFNSRIQDAYVTNISKYGRHDMDFVLGTSQGFLHLINGHLFAKATYTDLDDNMRVLSGDCTYAGCYEIDNGTSIENRFLFTDGNSLYNVLEHNFDAKCEIDTTFKFTDEIVNDIFRIGDGAYVICTNKGIYTSRPRFILKDYLDDYMLSDLNNDVDMAFSRLLNQHVKDRHFAGSDMDMINHKIDKNFNPYPAGFTNTSPVVTSRHVLDVDNDLVESMEVRLTDDQAAANTSNIFAAVKNEVLNNAFTATRTYAPPGWFDHVVDINDSNHVVDYSDVRYICRRWRSGVVEFYIYIPTTFTYYFNNLAGYSQSPYAGLSLTRPNAGNLQLTNDVKTLRTTLRLFISNTTYKLNTIYMAQIVGNSLPLKIYKESTYCDSNRAGLFDAIVQPSVVRALPLMVGRSKNNVNPLMNASEQICLDFAIYGTDAQAIHIMAR